MNENKNTIFGLTARNKKDFFHESTENEKVEKFEYSCKKIGVIIPRWLVELRDGLGGVP